MATCSFCGHENADGSRSCVSCGYVFAEPDGDDIPDAHRPADDLAAELGALARPAPGEGSGSPREADDPAADAPEHLARLYDPSPVAKTVRQVTILAGVAGALALVVAVTGLLDTLEALDELGAEATVFFGEGALPRIAGRADLLALGEHSVFAGVLVMLGGWAQEVGAARSLLGVDHPRRDAGGMLRAFVVLGPNVVNAGRAVRELWSDNAPPATSGTPAPPAVRWFGVVFGAAVAARLASVLWGFTVAPTPGSDGEAVLAGVVVVGTRLLWVAALAAGVLAVRVVSERQRERARLLANA